MRLSTPDSKRGHSLAFSGECACRGLKHVDNPWGPPAGLAQRIVAGDVPEGLKNRQACFLVAQKN